MQLLLQAPWPGNIRQLRNLVESMVVLAPGSEIRAVDIPGDVTEGMGSLLPARINPLSGSGGGLGMAEFEFILRSLMELRVQVEELRRRLEQRPDNGDVHVIEVSDPSAQSLAVPAVGLDEDDAEVEEEVVVYRPGMTMAEVERAAIEAVLRRAEGNRRRAAQDLGIGERTLYRKLKEYEIS
jgi:DNA-binding NtrC family response regulator